MVTKLQRKALTKEGYRIIGTYTRIRNEKNTLSITSL